MLLFLIEQLQGQIGYRCVSLDGYLAEGNGLKYPKVCRKDGREYILLMDLDSPIETKENEVKEAEKLLKEAVLDHMITRNSFKDQSKLAKALLFGEKSQHRSH